MLVGEGFPDIYVHRLAQMLDRNMPGPYRLHCITDRKRNLPAKVNQIDSSGWDDVRRDNMRVTTMKLRLYDPASMPFEEFLYLDVSLVIQRDLSCLLSYCDSRCEPLVMVRDWNYDVFNTCVMRIRHSDELFNIYKVFTEGKTYKTRWNGDQDFVSACLLDHGHQDRVAFFDPDHVVSYRNLRFMHREDARAAYEEIKKATIVKFHGRVKMHQILNPYQNLMEVRLKNFRHGSRDARFWRKELRALWQ